ncbi:MAG: hypothetical protein U9N53_03030 [Bacteroidota bacterium]|nr:hypothetical protein [Bacteroidota bacterium]
MKKHLLELFPRIVRYSKKLDDLAVLTNKPWVMMIEGSTVREVWIFKRGGDLIISRDGIAIKGSWDYIKEAKSIYIEAGEIKRLFNQTFADDIALLMKLDGDKEIFAFANQNKIEKNFKILKYLEKKLNELQPKAIPLSPKPSPKPFPPPKLPPPKELTIDEMITEVRDNLNTMIFLIIFLTVMIIALGIIFIFNGVYQVFIIIGGVLLVPDIMFFQGYRSKRKELGLLLNKKKGKETDSPSKKREME